MKKIERKPVGAPQRVGALVLALALSAAGLVGVYRAVSPAAETQEQVLYSYGMDVGGVYRVNLKQNELYSEAVLPEDRLYANALTASIETVFTLKFTGTQSADISGNFQTDAVVRGTQGSGDAQQLVYERVFPLAAKREFTGQTRLELTDKTQVQLEPYRQFADKAEQILGARPSKTLLIRFSGEVVSETEFGQVREPFAYSIQVPFGEELFSVSKDNPVQKQDAITESRQLPLERPDKSLLLPSVLLLLTGIFGAFAVLRWTCRPSREKARELEFRKLVRRHGSRMAQLRELPPFLQAEPPVILEGFDSLMKISDEAQRPIFYCCGEQGLPKDGLLWVIDGDRAYIWYFEGG